MARDQKIKSKAAQAQKNAIAKQRVAPVPVTQPQISATQTTDDATNVVPEKVQIAPESVVVNTFQITDIPDTANTANETSIAPEERVSMQPTAPGDQPVVWTGLQPSWPEWPTSKPGPHSKPPSPGTRSINKLRSEQFAEVGYNQQTGEPASQNPLRSLPDERSTGPTSFDLPTAQDIPGKRKQRL